jgi:hypothetical protein
LKKNYFSLHKLPKQQSTSFWSQGILGVKQSMEEETIDLSFYQVVQVLNAWKINC